MGQSMTAQAFCVNMILGNEQRRKKTQKIAQVFGKATHDQLNQKPWKNQAAKEPQPFSGLTSDRCCPRLPVGP
jgi:hypothetical protein